MNLRLEDNYIRFRISKEELDTLLANKIISNSTMAIKYCIELSENTQNPEVSYYNNKLTFMLPEKKVTDHKNTLPNKDGIIEEIKLRGGNTIIVSLEVDVFKNRKKISTNNSEGNNE